MSLGGEDPGVRPADRLHRLVQLLLRARTSGATRPRGWPRSVASPGPAVPYNTYHGSTRRATPCSGAGCSTSARGSATATRLSFNNTYTRGADNEAPDLHRLQRGILHPTFDFARLTFTERSVRSNQLPGEHLLGQRSFVVVVDHLRGRDPQRARPLRRGLRGRARATGPVHPVPVEWFGQARFATRTFSDPATSTAGTSAATTGCCSARSTPGHAQGRAAPTGQSDRDADTRAYDIVNRPSGRRGRRQQAPEARLRDRQRRREQLPPQRQRQRRAVHRRRPDHRRVRSSSSVPVTPGSSSSAAPGSSSGTSMSTRRTDAGHDPLRPSRRNTDILPVAGAELPPDARPEPAALGDPDAVPARVPRAVAGRLLRAGRPARRPSAIRTCSGR